MTIFDFASFGNLQPAGAQRFLHVEPRFCSISAILAWQIGSQFLFEDLFCDSWLFFVVDWQSGRGADPRNPNPVPSPESLVTININMGFADIHQCVQNIRSITIKENSNGNPICYPQSFQRLTRSSSITRQTRAYNHLLLGISSNNCPGRGWVSCRPPAFRRLRLHVHQTRLLNVSGATRTRPRSRRARWGWEHWSHERSRYKQAKPNTPSKESKESET